jgi:hypothetical protein
MDKIEFRYFSRNDFSDNEECNEICFALNDKDGMGINSYTICEKFMDFMRAVGYSERNVIDYFSQPDI